MANKKVTDLTADTSPVGADLLHMIADVATTPVNRKVLLSDLFNDMATTAAEVAASVTPIDLNYPEGDVRRYGAAVDGTTDDTTAINNAILVAVQGGVTVQLGAGTSRCESDVLMKSKTFIRGHQHGSHLEFNGASLFIDGANHTPTTGADRFIKNWGLDNVRVSRIGTAGFAVRFIGHGGTGAGDDRLILRFDVNRLIILGSTGGGLELRGVLLGAFHNLLIQDCTGTGLEMLEVTGTAITSVNAVQFVGGEIQNCTKAINVDKNLQGIAFYQFTIEGNSEGADFRANCFNVTFDTPFFEANGVYDIRVGNDTGGGASRGFYIRNGRITDGAPAKAHSIILDVGLDVIVEACTFNGYGTAAIDDNSFSGVTGVARRNSLVGGTPALITGPTLNFHQDPEEQILTASPTWNPSDILDGNHEINDVTVTGAALGDLVEVSPSGSLLNLTLGVPVVLSSNTVRLTLLNNSGASVDLGLLTYRVKVHPKGSWF